MANTVAHLEITKNSLNDEIDQAIESYSNKNKMPERDSDIVKLYQKKAAKNYDVARSKNDIENAVELLSIAYNLTPLKAGEVRVKIANIQQKVIRSQGDAERMMAKVAREAKRISDDLEEVFSTLQTSNEQEKKDFIINEFSNLVKSIENKASNIHDGLIEVAQSFEEISKETLDATSSSELVLGNEVQEREKIKQAIAEYRAKQASLEKLLESLHKSIEKYNQLAKEMGEKADTADKRAFITGLVQIGAQALASVAAVACMSMGGPTGMATRSAASTIRDVTKQESTDDRSNDGKSDENPAEIETSKANAQLDKKQAQDKVNDLEHDISTTKDEIQKIQEIDKKSEESATKESELEQLQNTLKQKETELEDAQKKLKQANDKLENLQNRLDKVSESANQVRKQELEIANSFRKLQIDFLNKTEAYEKENMKQDAELVQIKSLLASKANVHESIELTIKTLILSIKSLKQIKTILEEVAAFFNNFAAFLKEVSKDAEKQSELVTKAASGSSFSMKRVINGIDKFTISQCAEWYATEDLASGFVDAFNSGWKMMNDMSGKYLDEQELKDYIVTASNRIEEIAKLREKAANAKISHMNQYRDKLNTETEKEQRAV